MGTAEDAHPPTERMMAMLATFAYVRVLILWSYWLFSKVAKVANIPTGVKVAIFEFKHGHRSVSANFDLYRPSVVSSSMPFIYRPNYF